MKRIGNIQTILRNCTPKTRSTEINFKAAAKGDIFALKEHLISVNEIEAFLAKKNIPTCKYLINEYELGPLQAKDISPLKHGICVNDIAANEWSLLHFAVKSGNADLVKLLIDKGADVNYETKTEGISPLHIAAAGNNRIIIQYLLDAGADLKATDKQGSTALHYAMTNNNLFSAQLLIEKKCDFSQINQLGFSPITLMAQMAHLQCKGRDELKFDYLQALMFTGIAASYISGYCSDSLSGVLGTIATAATIAPQIMILINANGIKQIIPLIAMNHINFPGKNIALAALKTYTVGKAALKSLTAVWKYRHIETARPIRNALIHGMNAAFSCQQLKNSITEPIKDFDEFQRKEADAEDEFQKTEADAEFDRKSTALINTLGSKIDRPITIKQLEHYNRDYIILLNKFNEECLPTGTSASECNWIFRNIEAERFETQGIFSLPYGDIKPNTCTDLVKIGVDLKECIDSFKLNPDFSNHASAILGVSTEASTDEYQQAFRALAINYHTDKNATTASGELMKAISAAYARLSKGLVEQNVKEPTAEEQAAADLAQDLEFNQYM